MDSVRVQWGILNTSVAVLLLFLLACDPRVQRRPYGYLKIGKVQELMVPEVNLESLGLYLRYDGGGFSVMSTYCTHDLSYLLLKKMEAGEIWVSELSESTYAKDGKVLTGPAIVDLPYYELVLAAAEYGGPKDTLYVQVGAEKSKEWRLKYPLP